MYKKLIAPVAIAVVATVGLVGGTVSAQEVSAPVFDENGNSAVVEVTCENITLRVQHNRVSRQENGNWLRSFYMGGPLPANGSPANLADPQLIDVSQNTVESRNVASADVVVHYFSGDRDLGATPGTWQANPGWVPVETTVIDMAEDCPVEETTVPAVTTSTPQVTQVPVGPVNAGGSNAIVASFVAFIGSLVGLGYGVARLRKTN